MEQLQGMRLKVAKTPYESGPTRGTSPRYGSVSAGGPCRRTGAAVLDVPIQNLNPDVMMMEPAEDRYRCDAAELLRRRKPGASLSNERCVRIWL